MTRFLILSAACIVAVQSGLACDDDDNTPVTATGGQAGTDAAATGGSGGTGGRGAGGSAGTDAAAGGSAGTDAAAGGSAGDASADASTEGGGGDASVSEGGDGKAGGTAGDAGDAGDGSTLLALAAQLSDAEMLRVLEVANAGEVRQGLTAQKKATRADVKNFASMMVTEHTAATKSVKQVEGAMGMTPQANAVSTMIERVGAVVLNALNTMGSGPAYDRLYMQTQVDAHKNVLAVIGQMQANADASQLKTLLATMHTEVQEHLTEAQQILGTMASR